MKKLFTNVLIVFVAFQILNAVHHGYILKGDYDQMRNTGIYRSQEDISHHYAYMLIGQMILSFAFVVMYRMGKETKPWLGQGLRFGILISMVSVIPNYLTYFSVEPLPVLLVSKQIILDTVMVLIVGILLAYLEHPMQDALNKIKDVVLTQA